MTLFSEKEPHARRRRSYNILVAVICLIVIIGAGYPLYSEYRSRDYISNLISNWGLHSNDENNGKASPPVAFDDGVSKGELDTDARSDVSYRPPRFNVQTLKDKRPHNYRGPGHATFATFYSSRNATMHNPYFVAAQQVVYRLLWDPHIRSERYPVTVFVMPFVAQEQRDYFSAAGAIVRELPLHVFSSLKPQILDEKFVDVQSKLLLWNQTEFSRVVALDSDAFPWVNIDSILSDRWSPLQKCKTSLLSPEDQDIKPASDTCHYVFSGYTETWEAHMINAGVMVLKPDAKLSEMLLRLAGQREKYDNRFPEQAPITLFYAPDGPFPSSLLTHGWNGGADRVRNPDTDSYIVHDKIWAMRWGPDKFVQHDFNATWSAMLDLYESRRFRRLRSIDDEQQDMSSDPDKEPADRMRIG